MSIYEEGYIKYNAVWEKTETLVEVNNELISYRNKLYDIGLIGVLPDGIGFGNISQRLVNATTFIISGTQTGNIVEATAAHFSKVTATQIAKNYLTCEGPVQASSEAMTHAAIYEASNSITSVIHVHHSALWQTLLNQVETVPQTITYGTPEMALAMAQKVKLIEELHLPKIIITAGHADGIFTFGNSIEQAFDTLMHYFKAQQ